MEIYLIFINKYHKIILNLKISLVYPIYFLFKINLKNQYIKYVY